MNSPWLGAQRSVPLKGQPASLSPLLPASLSLPKRAQERVALAERLRETLKTKQMKLGMSSATRSDGLSFAQKSLESPVHSQDALSCCSARVTRTHQGLNTGGAPPPPCPCGSPSGVANARQEAPATQGSLGARSPRARTREGERRGGDGHGDKLGQNHFDTLTNKGLMPPTYKKLNSNSEK